LTLFNYNDQGIFISDRGRIGINTTSPATALDVNGRIKTTSLQIPGVAPDDSSKSITGYVLRSLDINGNAGWTAQSNLDDGDWTKSGNDIYRLNGNVGIGVSAPIAQLELADLGFEGGMNLKIGDEAYLSDIDEPHTLGVLSCTNHTIGAIKLGLDGPVLFGNDNGFLGIGTDTPSGLLSLYRNNPAENFGISFQNGSSTKYWIGHNIANDLFFIGGTGGATPEMGAINIRSGNVGIGTNTPSKALDVNGDIQFSGDLYKYGQLLDFNLWEENADKIYYNQGNVGIGVSDPLAKLHIASVIANANAEFFKVENSGQEGSGTTIIGKKYNGGPVFIQQAGTTNFSNQGSTLSFFQKSSNGDVGLGISTYTGNDGTVGWVDMYAQTSNFYVRAEEDLILRSRTGNLVLGTNDGSQYVHINSNGQVGIGTQTHIDNSFTRLTVAGRIHAKEVKVTVNAGGADFVFNKTYDLPNLKEIDKFISTNKHLPDIPSAEEMQQNGINLGEMQIKLLQKIEELTLYVIELKKESEVMKEAINKLKEN